MGFPLSRVGVQCVGMSAPAVVPNLHIKHSASHVQPLLGQFPNQTFSILLVPCSERYFSAMADVAMATLQSSTTGCCL